MSRASLAAAYAKAGDVAGARRMGGGVDGPAAAQALAAFAKVGQDTGAAAFARGIAEGMKPDRAKAEALANAAAAVIALP